MNKIKFAIFDFDGVFTDGTILFDSNGQIIKKYNVKDGLGIKKLQENDISVGVISGFKENLSQKGILSHLNIEKISIGSNNKLEILNKWCEELNITLGNVAYMGDDINDLVIHQSKLGLFGCPSDAIKEINCESKCNYTWFSSKKGGDGCVREFCDYILENNNRSQRITGLICVKYLSNRMPFKNIRKFGNTTLLDYKIKNLLSLSFLDEVVVNTESQFIIEYLKKKYVNKRLKIIKRDSKYSLDSTENFDFCKNVVSSINTNYVLYSPVTMPFITKNTYNKIFWKMKKNKYDSIILAADGKQGAGHNHEKHSFCFGASLMKVDDVLKYGDFIGVNPYLIKCNSLERLDIDYPHEFNQSLYHYFNNDGLYGNENKISLNNNDLFKFNDLDLSNIDCNLLNTVSDNKITNEVKIIDVTIRDGGFDNKWNWKLNEVKDMLKCASDTGIEYFEIGYLCDKDLLKENDGHFRNVSFETIDNIVNEVKPNCKIAVLFDSWRYNTNNLLPKNMTNIDLVRVVTYMEENKLECALDKCREVKNKGYLVSLNIMCASYFTSNIIDNIKTKIYNNIDYLDYVYFADSYGSMTPDNVSDVFQNIATLKEDGLKIGFHIHNNGQIGMANMITSLKYVDIIDASYWGMGRGMGNVRLEDVILFLKIKKNYNLNIQSFLEYFEKNTKNIDEIKNTLLGFMNIHPYRINNMSLNNFYEHLCNLPFSQKYDYNK